MIKVGNKYGFANSNSGIIVISAKYDRAYPFENGLATVIKGYIVSRIDLTGRVVKHTSYDYIGEDSEGFSIVKKGGKFSFIDRNGKRIVPLIYDNLSKFSNGISTFTINGRNGKIDSSGKQLSFMDYDWVGVENDGFRPVRKDGKWSFINRFGDLIAPLKYNAVERFINGKAIVRYWGRYGLIDTNGNEIVKPTKQSKKELELQVSPSSDTRDSVSGGQISKFNFGYDEIGTYSEGLIVVRKGNKYGFVDARSNKLVIPCRYDLAYPFFGGRSIVKQNGKYGVISKDGSIIEAFRFGSFDEALGRARFDNSGSQKSSGQHPFKPYTPPSSNSGVKSYSLGYDEIGTYSEGLIVVRKGNKFGFIDARSNKLVIPCEYDSAYPFFGGKAIVMKKGKYGIIDINGRCVLPFIYSFDEVKNRRTL